MQLHRTTGQPDWANLPTNKYNWWQTVAAATHSIVTPGNLVSLLGFSLVLYGLTNIHQHHYLAGAVWLVIGRLCDVIDGWAADKTGTKSPLGEMVDVIADKLETLAAVIVIYLSHTVAWWLLAALLLPQIINPFITLYKAIRHQRFHPSRAGKFSMTAVWLSLIGLIAVHGQHGFNQDAVYGLTALSVSLGVYATIGYLR